MAPGAGAQGPVVVVGAGPVGLLLAVRLGLLGIGTLVLERRHRRQRGSRAIGVHPPGVAALDGAGVLVRVRERAVRLTSARATGASGAIAELDLTRAGEVLAVPQDEVERALEARLRTLPAVELREGCAVEGLEVHRRGVEVQVRSGDGTGQVSAVAVIGCDGRASTVRRALGVRARGGPYGDRYVMADLPRRDSDSTAEVILHRDGVVESFPLLGARRWVVHAGFGTADDVVVPPADALAAVIDAVQARLDIGLSAEGASFASAFAVERLLADRFAIGRVALVGDAAHVVSPIGGQGMNLGWIDAVELVRAMTEAPGDPAAAFGTYAARRRPAALRAIRRAALNTYLGRPVSRAGAVVRDAILRRALRPPFADAALGAFTMRGLT